MLCAGVGAFCAANYRLGEAMLIDYSQRLLFLSFPLPTSMLGCPVSSPDFSPDVYTLGSNLRWPTTIPYHHLFEVWRDMSPYEPY
jgi:hypothetical protein